MQVLYVSAFFWITGLYFTKLSLAIFYFHLFPPIMARLRVALWIVTIYIMIAFITSLIILLAWYSDSKKLVILHSISDFWLWC
jgi:hypothetical protein